MYLALALLSFCINAESIGTTAFQNGVSVAKKLIQNVENLGNDVLKDAKALRKEIQDWKSKIGNLSNVKLDDYVDKLSTANGILSDVETNSKSIMKSVKSQTELQIRTLQKALDTGVEENFQKAISCTQIIMVSILKKSAERLMELVGMIQKARELYLQVSDLSATYAQECQNEIGSNNSRIAKKANKLRTDAYAGCVASVAFPPLILPCYLSAIAAVETTVKKWWEEHNELIGALNKFKSKFQSIGKKADNMITVAESMYADLTDARTKLGDKEENIVASDDFDYWQQVILDDELPTLVKDLANRI